MPNKTIEGIVDPRSLKEGVKITGISANLGAGKGEALHEVGNDHGRYNQFVHHYVHGRNAESMRTHITTPEGMDHPFSGGGALNPSVTSHD